MGNYRGCSKWKEAKAVLARQARTPRVPPGDTGRTAVRKVARNSRAWETTGTTSSSGGALL
jgi:hypothetical protein